MLLTAHSGEKAKAFMILVASQLSPSWWVKVLGVWTQCVTLSASQPSAWPGFLIILIHIWCQIKPHPACAPILRAPSRLSQWRRVCDGKGFGWSVGRGEKITCECEDNGGGQRVRMEWRKNHKVIAEILWQMDTSIPPWYQSLLYA